MSEIVYLNFPTKLLGRWRPEYEEDDGRSEYEISLENGQIKVTGQDFGNGERYVISNIEYDTDRVAFDMLEPSTRRTGHVALTVTAHGETAMARCTFIYISKASKLAAS